MGSSLSDADAALLATLGRPRRLRVEDYHRMVEAGIVDEDERLELVEGVIVEMSPQNPRHAAVITRLCDPAFVRLEAAYVLRCQLPLTLSSDSEPEPDVAVVERGAEGDRHRHPSTARLVIEVAGDSLRKDRVAKAAVYAGAGIPEYAIVNLEEDVVEVYREPDSEGRRYRSVSTLRSDDTFASATVPGFAFTVGVLLK